MIDQCPICGSTKLYELDASQFCPNEDYHPGGVVIFADGLTLASGLAPCSTIVVEPPNNGGATT
jgi:hypothetical protein